MKNLKINRFWLWVITTILLYVAIQSISVLYVLPYGLLVYLILAIWSCAFWLKSYYTMFVLGMALIIFKLSGLLIVITGLIYLAYLYICKSLN